MRSFSGKRSKYEETSAIIDCMDTKRSLSVAGISALGSGSVGATGAKRDYNTDGLGDVVREAGRRTCRPERELEAVGASSRERGNE